MANNIDKKEPVAIYDQSKIDVTKCDNHELAGNIEPLIKVIRGQQVMLDKDLAMLYGVEAKVLNQAVKRNIERFPNDFRFQLTKEECLRSQIVTLKNNADETEEETSSKRGKHTKYLPYVFTQEGVAALSGVLRSPIAIQVNISIMRAFVALRQMITGYQELLKRIEELEESTDAQFSEIYQALTQLLSKPEPKPRKPIGYRTYDE